MSVMKTGRDVRSVHSLITGSAPLSDSAVFLRLHRLANEKIRLKRELEMWSRKKLQLENRLAEIEQQMAQMRGQPSSNASSRGQKTETVGEFQSIDLEY